MKEERDIIKGSETAKQTKEQKGQEKDVKGQKQRKIEIATKENMRRLSKEQKGEIIQRKRQKRRKEKHIKIKITLRGNKQGE